jgi:hypothetical protein
MGATSSNPCRFENSTLACAAATVVVAEVEKIADRAAGETELGS